MGEMSRILRAGLPAALVLTLIVAAAAAVPAHAQPPCEQFNPTGSSPYLPPDCKYFSPADVKKVKDPVALAELIAKPIHQFFICVESGNTNRKDCRRKGGSLGGNTEQFSSELVLEIEGTGSLAGYKRTVAIPHVQVQIDSGPDEPGNPVQDFPTEMMSIQGSLPPGDPDFDSLVVVGGTRNGFPSPGHLHAQFDPDRGVWTIDSEFDVGYTIRFQGAPGGPLAGHAGSSQGQTKMVAAGDNPDGCP